MRVYTRILFDWTGNILESDSYEYHGPISRCDRALNAQAQQAGKAATGTAANYGAEGNAIQGSLVPRLERQAENPQGYGAFGLGQMETGAEQSAAGATGAANERMRLNAIRTGNGAGLGAGEAAAAGEGARASGSALQGILAKNAELKASQQQQANTGLQGILGEDIKGQTSNASLVPEDINAGVNADKVGWVQNMTEILNSLRGAGGSSSGGASFGL